MTTVVSPYIVVGDKKIKNKKVDIVKLKKICYQIQFDSLVIHQGMTTNVTTVVSPYIVVGDQKGKEKLTW